MNAFSSTVGDPVAAGVAAREREPLGEAEAQRGVVGRRRAGLGLPARRRRLDRRQRVLDACLPGAEVEPNALGKVDERLHPERARPLRRLALPERRAEPGLARGAAAIELPVEPVVSADELAADAAGGNLPLEPRGELRRVRHRLEIERKEAVEERFRGRVAISEVGGDLQRAEGVVPRRRGESAFQRRIVVRRQGLARVGGDLRLGERARQAEVLVVGPEFQRQRAAVERVAQVAEHVDLVELVVVAVVVRVVGVRVHGEPEPFARGVRGAAHIVGAERAAAGEDRPGLRPRLRTAGDDVDRPAGRPAAVGDAAAAGEDLDPLDRFQRDRRQVRRREVDRREPHAVEEHQRILVAGDPEAAQVELLVRRAGRVADMHAAELPDDLGQRARGAARDVPGADHARADRRPERTLRKAGGGDDDPVEGVLRDCGCTYGRSDKKCVERDDECGGRPRAAGLHSSFPPAGERPRKPAQHVANGDCARELRGRRGSRAPRPPTASNADLSLAAGLRACKPGRALSRVSPT